MAVFKAKKRPKTAIIHRIFQVFYLVKSADLPVFSLYVSWKKGNFKI